MENVWQLLGVSTDADLKTLKRAYGRLIRQYRPDSHPTEFAKIRQAYEFAKQYMETRDIASNQMHGSNDSISNKKERQSLFELGFEQSVEGLNTPLEKQEFDSVGLENDLNQQSTIGIQLNSDVISEKLHEDSFQSEPEKLLISQGQVNRLVEDYMAVLAKWKKSGYCNDKNFYAIKTHKALDRLESFEKIKFLLFDFLVENISIASTPVGRYQNIATKKLLELDAIFDWRESNWEFFEEFNEDSVDLFFDAIGQENGFFGFFQKVLLIPLTLFAFTVDVIFFLVALVLTAFFISVPVLWIYTSVMEGNSFKEIIIVSVVMTGMLYLVRRVPMACVSKYIEIKKEYFHIRNSKTLEK